MKKIVFTLILALPALAGFKSTTQVVPLKFGQQSATVVFETTGEEIEEAEPHCDCTKVQVKGTRLTAVVDTRTFDRDVEKTIAAETEDGKEVTLRMQFKVPQAIHLSARSLVWKRGAAPTPQVLRITLPQGGPITHIADAALSGDAFDYAPKVVKRGREYTVTITPRSTAKAALNRLVLTTDSADPRYHRQIIYLQIKK
ncbi:MAG: hypothetical protein IJX33_04770 [Akkermansia sp.]|nr:hypothetical protein [Akkermansia sp.]